MPPAIAASVPLCEQRFRRILDALVARFADSTHQGTRLEAWLFEDVESRRAAEARLRDVGVEARLRSAYKPLLHAFLEEEVMPAPGDTVSLSLPAGMEDRFRLEAYPLAALLGPSHPLRFVVGESGFAQSVILRAPDGTERRHHVFLPNRLRTDHLGTESLVPCGWLRVWPPGAATPAEDAPLFTEYEQVFDCAMATLLAQDWDNRNQDSQDHQNQHGTGPAGSARCFEVLEIHVETGGIEQPLPVAEEAISTREALHEDLYFSVLELFQRRAGLPVGDRTLQPGQILPDIRPGTGDTRLCIRLRAPLPELPSVPQREPLAALGAPLEPDRLRHEVEALGGERFDATSVQGRPVYALHHRGTGAPVVVSAAQHANETAGVVGALRAAAVLRAEGRHFALIPLENPDGYALHRQLRRIHPHHMHHAARYTALGDDLEARAAAPWYEAAARHEAFRRTGTRLHVNLHGYPAHEWTRPLTGYVPRGFERWTVPRGFFLILRHHPGLAAEALALVQGVAELLGNVPGLRDFNRRCLDSHRLHAGAEAAGPVHADIPYMLVETARHAVPFTLITEYPDETVGGDSFRLAQEAQCAAVLAAASLSAIWAPAGS